MGVKLALALAFLLAIAGVYLMGYGHGQTSERLKWQKTYQTAQAQAIERERAQRIAASGIDAARQTALTETAGKVRQLEVDLRRAMRAQPSGVCIPPGSSVSPVGDPSESPSAPGGDGQSAGAETDIAVQLARFAGRCERDRTGLIELQMWVKGRAGTQ